METRLMSMFMLKSKCTNAILVGLNFFQRVSAPTFWLA